MNDRHPEGVAESCMASTYLSLNVHVVFATKGRKPTIDPAWRRDLHAYIGGTVRGLGAVPIAVGGVADHVHLLAGFRATQCVADVVREIKKASSVWAADQSSGFAWQVGYGAFSVSPTQVPSVVAYIAEQEEHHRRVSSAEELRALLLEYGIPCDERFFE